MCVRKARPDEAMALSALASQSKAHWGYDAETAGRVIGFYMLHLDTPQTIEHLWIHPESLRSGVGSLLIKHALELAREGRGPTRVVSDPYAAGFYEHHGGVRTDSVSAPLPGMSDRTLPVYEFR